MSLKIQFIYRVGPLIMTVSIIDNHEFMTMTTYVLIVATYVNSAALSKGNLNTCSLQLQYDMLQKTDVFATPLLENTQHLESWD